MEILDSGKDKVKKICETLKKQTLDPAKQEAKAIIDQALKEAEKIVKRAKDEAKEVYEENKLKMIHEKKAFHSSLQLASRQTLEVLRQEIEAFLFNKYIGEALTKETSKENVVAEFTQVIVDCLKKEGIEAPLEIMIPKALSKDVILAKLSKECLEGVSKESIVLGGVRGGVKVKVKDRHLILEISDESLKELFARFIREDFRSLLFENKT